MTSIYVCSGNLTRDATMNTTSKGTKVCGFSVAVNVGYGDRQTTHFVDCSIWAKRGETLAPMLEKGTSVIVGGEMKLETYPKKDGTEGTSLRLNVDTFDFQQRSREDSGNSGSNPQTYGKADEFDSIPDLGVS
mgnify:FL=1